MLEATAATIAEITRAQGAAQRGIDDLTAVIDELRAKQNPADTLYSATVQLNIAGEIVRKLRVDNHE